MSLQQKISYTLKEMESIYLAPDNRPWIVAFSGGKDSTFLLQLVFKMLLGLPPSKRKRVIYVLSSNTLVEAPNIAQYLKDTIEKINAAAYSLELPIKTNIVFPDLNDTFFVRLIGYGYPAPNRWFRWCTERLKIKPTSRFITELALINNSVLILLGSRLDESSNRAQSIRKHSLEGLINKHNTIPNAWVYTPIKNFNTDEVWTYLLQVPSFWGADNTQLVSLYRDAGGGECPLVMDKDTPSCGNTRFGCWVCTVVDRDKSMEGFIASGYERYIPLLEFRNYLAELRDREDCREKQRRNGQPGLGPLKIEIRQKLKDDLLSIQDEIKELLITEEELEEINKVWISDSLKSMAII